MTACVNLRATLPLPGLASVLVFLPRRGLCESTLIGPGGQWIGPTARLGVLSPAPVKGLECSAMIILMTWGELIRRLRAAGFVERRVGKGSHRQEAGL